MLLATMQGGGGGGGVNSHPMTTFFNCLTLLMKMIFINKKFKIILVPPSYFSLLLEYPSLLNDL